MLNKKVVVVIGGSGLLGKSFVENILKNKGTVIQADLKKIPRADTLKKNLYFEKIDANQSSSLKKLIKKYHSKLGKIDAVVNTSYPKGEFYGKSLNDLSIDNFNDNVSLHLGSYFLVMQQFCIYFKRNKYGNLINISSIYGSLTPRFDIYENTKIHLPVEYVAAKSAIIQLTKYFAQLYKNYGIRINCISPGGIFNNQDDNFVKSYFKYAGQKGMLEPKDINSTLTFLLSDQSKYINGQNIIIDDGFSL